jgi:guanine deaminase
VGAGTGFGMLKEALQCYMMQRLLPDGMPLTPTHLLYLATRAGADALGLSKETGDFSVGKSADLVRIQPVAGTPLAGAMAQAETPEGLLAAIITQAGAESIQEVRVYGEAIAR